MTLYHLAREVKHNVIKCIINSLFKMKYFNIWMWSHLFKSSFVFLRYIFRELFREPVIDVGLLWGWLLYLTGCLLKLLYCLFLYKDLLLVYSFAQVKKYINKKSLKSFNISYIYICKKCYILFLHSLSYTVFNLSHI